MKRMLSSRTDGSDMDYGGDTGHLPTRLSVSAGYKKDYKGILFSVMMTFPSPPLSTVDTEEPSPCREADDRQSG